MVSLMVMHGVWAVMLGAGTLTDVALVHDGLTRNYKLYTPDTLPTGPVPVTSVPIKFP